LLARKSQNTYVKKVSPFDGKDIENASKIIFLKVCIPPANRASATS